MKSKIVDPADFAQAIRGDGLLPFMTGQEALAERWAAAGGGPEGLLSLLAGRPRAGLQVAGTALLETA